MPAETSQFPRIQIYNTLTRAKEEFKTVEPGKVGMYLCGPTVYKEAHIGHMVGPVIFDTVKRYLVYVGYEVNWVVNITDVDDKLIAESSRRKISMSQVANEMTMDYCSNLLELGVNQISVMPKATENMDEIIQFIAELIDKDFAYEVDSDVFFDVLKDSEYGKLTNRSADEQLGEGGNAAGKKRSAADFALW
ncbi:MAG: cysteine--tRNA ligase, partial [Planctomycetota bacterium]|nr:cysteine--tRNA ligase [Planctomycetota bacterium]